MNSPIRYKQLVQLILAHARQIIREPGVLFWGIIFPILMSLGLGIAFTKKADVTRDVAWISTWQSPSGTEPGSLISAFMESNHAIKESDKDGSVLYRITIPDDKLGNTTFTFRTMNWQKAMVLLKRGNLTMIIGERYGQIEYHFDPLNPDAQLIYLKLSNLFQHPSVLQQTSNTSIKPLTVTGTRYVDFLVPGLIAMGVMMSIMWGVSYEIIDNRAKKLLRRMVATPMKKSHYLIALITVRVGMNFVESGLLFLFTWIAFGIKVQGSVPALITIFMAGNIAFAGIAIFMSSHTAKTEIGNGLINLVSMPMMVLSGIFFSYHNFPEWSSSIIQKFPLTMLADGIRSVFIEGAGFAEIAVPALILASTGIIFFLAGLKIFRWH
ncbi:MAG: ABC transporter permease [Bacteroidetes bacterium]|nr:ABC transporter permease [Bacteroidota bacterium]